jgi:F420-0:gamma-glutamyl ligase-like protein
VAALPMVTQRYDVIQWKRRISWGILVGKLAKKRKSVAQSKLRTMTYVEVSARNRSDSGRYKFSNVRGADSQGNV